MINPNVTKAQLSFQAKQKKREWGDECSLNIWTFDLMAIGPGAFLVQKMWIVENLELWFTKIII